MNLLLDQVGPIRRVTLTGRLDADGLKEIETDFHTAVTAGPDVIVDLSGVPFLASLGIRMLVSASKDQQKLGGKLVLVAPDELTGRILFTTGIDQLIPVCADTDTAVSKF